MRSDEEHHEDPKQPKPIKHRKKETNHFELLETDGRARLTLEDLDRHSHV